MDLGKFDILIFDFDGTLINSEPYHKAAHSKVLSMILGENIFLDNNAFAKYIGKKDVEIFEMYKKDFNVDFNKAEMINNKIKIAKEMLLDDSVKIYDYFFDLLKHKGNKKFYVVSNQDEDLLISVLENKKINKYFNDIFCLPKMEVAKNVFYKNINNFIPDAKSVLVFEDDVRVLNFLKDEGYDVIAIQNEMNSSQIAGNFENVIKTY